MGYVLDRQLAFRDTELVAVVAVRQRGIRSQLFLKDGRLAHTLTRPRTFRRKLQESHGRAFTQIA